MRAMPLILLATCVLVPTAHGKGLSRALEAAFAGVSPADIPSGVLYDRVLPLSNIGSHDGEPISAPASRKEWRQIYDEMRRAALRPSPWPELASLDARLRQGRAPEVIPLAFLDARYERIRPDAFANGALQIQSDRLVVTGNDAFSSERAFAVTAWRDHTARGARVVFEFPPSLWFSNTDLPPQRLAIDFDDGRGSLQVRLGARRTVGWSQPGTKLVRVTATFPDGSVRHASFPFDVERLGTPSPDDTLSITASVPYAGTAGTGEAYVYLAPTNAALTRPVVVIEGFDLDNSMDWDELYSQLNQENLIESLRAAGFDAVVLNFTNATDYLQRNSMVVGELIQQVENAIDPETELILVGASMGGLASRYALAYLESENVPHRVRTFISFDAPQRGANIPLGMQYWLDFFAEQSADAAFLLSRLDQPAARQMLAYHHTTPPGSTGEGDPLRTEFLADLAALGDWPTTPRLVAIGNGSGAGTGQGFAAGAQVISWVYRSFFLDITGNVWAVPDPASTRIFEGLIDPIFVAPDQQNVTVAGTSPYDNAPGGSRASMAEMDATPAPYGDIVALYPSHCFIPTVSALGIETNDLFYDIAGDPDLLAHTPFDAVYFPANNQPHVSITPENAAWFLGEITAPPTAVTLEAAASRVPRLHQNHPNPFNPSTTIRFELHATGPVQLSIHDVRGTRIATLVDRVFPAGGAEAIWNGLDARGQHVAAGVYVYRLRAADRLLSRKLTLLP